MATGQWFASESGGQGIWALSESAATAPVITAVDPVSGTELSVTWTGTASRYRLDGGTPAALPDGASPDTISGLTPNTLYAVEIDNGDGNWSNSVSEWTDNTGGGGGSLALDVGLAAETDTAYALALTKILTAGLASETDTALGPVLSNLGGGITVGAAEETDTALPLALRKILAAGVASETDSAQAVALRRALATGLAAESDSALSLALRKLLTTGRADEVDTALDMTLGSFSIGIAAETDTAFALDLISIQPAGPSEGGGGRPSWAKPLKGKRSAEGAMLARLLEEDKMLLGMVRDLYDSGAFEPLAEV